MFVAPLVLTLTIVPGLKIEKAVPVAPQPPAIAGRVLGFKQPAIGIPIVGGKPFIPPAADQPMSSGGHVPGVPSAMLSSAGGPPELTVLKNAKLGTTDKEILDFFQLRTPPAPARDKMAELVKLLGSNNVLERDKAQAQLTAIGNAAVPLLRQAANNIDATELAPRAREILQNNELNLASALVVHSARQLALTRPAGAAKALIGYLPYAEDDTAFAEVEAALVSVAMRDGKPDPAILEALKDTHPLRRGTAAQVLCQAGGTANYSAVRPLLKDERPSVRLRASLGLVSAYDSEAIPVLIELLSELAPPMRDQAEQYLISLAGDWAVSGPRGNDQMSRRLRRGVWEAWWKSTDGKELLEEFRSRSISDEDREAILGLIAKLGDAKAETREAASTDLIGMGKKAGPLLRQAVAQNDSKIAPFALKVLETIEKEAPAPLPIVAPRLLALRRPEGTVETLLNYLPFCETEETEELIVDILATVGCPGGKAHPALIKALTGKVSARRAAAVLALSKGKATGEIAAIQKLLTDKDAVVKLRAAQGLIMLGERDAINSLIGLLKDLPMDNIPEAEDFLHQIAGDKAPNEYISGDETRRTKVQEAWTKWYKDNAKTVELARLELQRREGGNYIIVEQYNPMLNRGRVMEVDASGKVVWEIRDLNWPNDAQVLKNGNVLIIEQQNRLTERDKTGKIVGLNRYYNNVFHVERLRDGNTFVACRNQLMVVDSKGNATFTHNYFTNTILAAKRFKDGTMAYISYGGQYIRLDAKGTQVKTFTIPFFNISATGAEILPGDRVVISDTRFNKVMEFGPDGKKGWECDIMNPLIPHRMSNGHILLAGNNNSGIYEIDRRGKIVKEWKNLTYKPYRVVRR